MHPNGMEEVELFLLTDEMFLYIEHLKTSHTHTHTQFITTNKTGKEAGMNST
jgi:hypothetical protein